ncbi:hypothetical protein [Bosea vaviloviae]|uniref:Uncharacterized protein n=1 Tax=Bosea vaviloviae TaxID=1526658 RepID=A0A1D7U6H6_9HYPH|nr:hypothetical protein [Bosea vaviloviae]AOO82981.1 hypothetical protein BHK69_23305 [Bosea vaviloviae]
MTNPFQKSADALVGRLGEIADDRRRAQEAVEAKRRERERSFDRVTALFAVSAAKVEECLRRANDAFDGSGVTLTKKVIPISDTAGSITMTLSGAGGQPAAFRIVGNAGFRLFVHELDDPKYGPFDLADAETLPYEEMVDQFIRSVTAGLAGRDRIEGVTSAAVEGP